MDFPRFNFLWQILWTGSTVGARSGPRWTGSDVDKGHGGASPVHDMRVLAVTGAQAAAEDGDGLSLA
jgi:hypothetical protein